MSVSSAGDSKVTTNSVAVQPSVSRADNRSTDEVVDATPEQLPEFEGGLPALMTFLVENVKYPEDAMNANIQGYVTVRFTITKSGEVKDVAVEKSVSPSLDAEAIRVVRSTSGKWTPGKTKGENVNVQYTLPISFKLK